ncbi:hypothetical protein WI23_26075 [Burkholderia oklahomensis C6786]|nr:hypothetical protein WI23_26075 [Burkholderia oklahomensis C6786]KUY60694.1 hypothetical protein WI23_13430 [Burkholderia oklahomensis C6786]
MLLIVVLSVLSGDGRDAGRRVSAGRGGAARVVRRVVHRVVGGRVIGALPGGRIDHAGNASAAGTCAECGARLLRPAQSNQYTTTGAGR